MTQPTNPDRHRNPGVLARPDPELREAARAVLDEHGWTVNDFVIACLMLVTQNPNAMLRSLGRVRPAARRGRPPASG